MDKYIDKDTLRKKMKALRDGIENMDEIAQSIYSHVMSMDEIKAAGCVFCYVSFSSEVGTHKIIDELIRVGKDVCVPKTCPDGSMYAVKIGNMSCLSNGNYGILEPLDGEIVEKGKIDVVIIPALCYDRNGYRVGYGGGYYDRYLKAFDALKIGLCPDECIVDDACPRDHDVGADVVITQSGVITIRRETK